MNTKTRTNTKLSSESGWTGIYQKIQKKKIEQVPQTTTAKRVEKVGRGQKQLLLFSLLNY